MPEQKNNDEIDLIALLLNAVNIFRANFWLILIYFLVGSALGVTYYFSSKKVFESKMIVSSNILTKTYGVRIAENMNLYLSEKNRTELAGRLGIPEQSLDKLRHVKIESLNENDDQKESDRFLITVEVYDPGILPELQNGFVHYLENNEFVKVRVAQNTAYLKQMIRDVENEISDMEEFKSKIYSGDFFQTVKGNVMFDPTTVNSKILDLKEKKLTYQNSLALSNSVQVIEGFTKFENPTKPKLSISLAAGSFIGLVFVGILIAYKSIRKLLRIADAAKKQ